MNSLHCNNCCHIPGCHEARRYFLSSCGHLICEKCYRQGPESCVICNQKTKFIEINADTKPEVKMFLMDPLETLQSSLKQWAQVYKFQQSQQKSFKNVVVKMVQQNRMLQKEIESLKSENAMLHKKLEMKDLKEQSFIGHGLTGFEKKKQNEPMFPLLGPSKSNFIPGRVTMQYGSTGSTASPSPNSVGFGNPVRSRTYGYGSNFDRFSTPSTGRAGSPSGISDMLSRFKKF